MLLFLQPLNFNRWFETGQGLFMKQTTYRWYVAQLQGKATVFVKGYQYWINFNKHVFKCFWFKDRHDVCDSIFILFEKDTQFHIYHWGSRLLLD